jgi:hypothetical protein
MVHHTASHSTVENDIAYILRGAPNPTPGRPNLAPICNLYLARDGVFHVIAAGRSVTNGSGSSRPWSGGVPDDAMNSHAISIEAANNGTGEPWPAVQTTEYVRGVAALCLAYDIPVNHVRAHAEWSPGRKIDPAGPSPWAAGARTWNMDAFRADVLRRIAVVIDPPTPPTPPPPPPVEPPHPTPTIHVEDSTMEVQNPPYRAIDTRPNGALVGGVTKVIDLGKPAKAAMVNLTAVAPTAAGFLTAWGAGDAAPNTSVVNFPAGETTANAVILPVDGSSIRVRSSVPTHLVVDVQAIWP